MTVKGAIVQNHVFAPTHALQDRTRSRHSSHGKSRAQSLAEGADIRLHAVIFLASAGSIAKAGDHFVKNQHRATFSREFSQALQVSISRKNATHVGHDGLGDHCGQFAPVLLRDMFESSHVVPGGQHDVVESRRRDAVGVRDARRVLDRAQLLRRMAVRVQEIGIVPSVIVSFELQEFTPAGMGAGQAQSQHGRFAARVGEAHHLGRWHHPAKTLGGLHFRRSRGGEVGAFRHRLGNRFDQGWVSVPLNEGAERHHEVDVFIAVRIPYVRSLAAFQHDRAGGIHGAPREGEFTPSTSDCCARSNHCWERVRFRVWLGSLMWINSYLKFDSVAAVQSAMPPPSTTSAAPVMKEESSEARNNAAFAISSVVPIRPKGRLAHPAR